MFKLAASMYALALGVAQASHLDNNNGIFDSFSFDKVIFKTRTNCSLDKYPEVSKLLSAAIKVNPVSSEVNTNALCFTDQRMARLRRSTVH